MPSFVLGVLSAGVAVFLLIVGALMLTDPQRYWKLMYRLQQTPPELQNRFGMEESRWNWITGLGALLSGIVFGAAAVLIFRT